MQRNTRIFEGLSVPLLFSLVVLGCGESPTSASDADGFPASNNRSSGGKDYDDVDDGTDDSADVGFAAESDTAFSGPSVPPSAGGEVIQESNPGPAGFGPPLSSPTPPPPESGGWLDPGDPIADYDEGDADDDSEDYAEAAPIANTNVNLGGSQDFGFFRAQLDAGRVPTMGSFDAAGFFAEHHLRLPLPDCGNRVCLQAMLGVMSNLINGEGFTMLQLGLNSPIAADPNNRPPLTLAVVVDVSGSMASQNKIGYVIDGLELMIDGLNDEDRFALVTYESTARTVFPMSDVAGNRDDMRALVRSMVASGGTNIYDGLVLGYEEVFSNYDSGRQNRVIILSDGNATSGITSAAEIVRMSAAYNSDGVGLTTIGLGTDFNVSLMRNLALQADGNYYFLENAGAVSEVFAEELSFFTVPIAFDLRLEVQAGSDYRFGRAVGSPMWEDTEEGGRLDVPSVFVAHRRSHKDVTSEGGRRGGGSALLIELLPRLLESDGSEITEAEVAIVDVEFREPGSNEVVSDRVLVNYPHAPWEIPEKGYFKNVNNSSTDVSVVQKSFVMLNIYTGIENAVIAYHENGGDVAQSIAELETLLAAVRAYNEELKDVDIDFDIALLQQLIDVMESVR